MNSHGIKPLNIQLDVESLKKTNDPIIIYALVDEAEAIANACKENGISVTAFCDMPLNIASNKVARIQESHIFLGHYIIEQVENLIINQ